MTTRRFLLLALPFLLVGFTASQSDFIVAAFTGMQAGGEINGWEPLTLGDAGETTYTLIEDGGDVVVKAEANDSASGLIRRVEADLNDFPVMSWRWKVDGMIPGGDVRRKGGDDYPARIYVTFDYDPSDLSFGDRLKYRALRALGYDDIPVRALNYIWANKDSETQIVPNAYTDWVQMVPVESGAAKAGVWQTAQRNVLEDYRAAFGEEPPKINGIAIMTDADNTGKSATAYFGDIRLLAE
ncbi:DUF3047 domain-containing protein [Rubricoccus marinus]|uniref:DUF3047 domain-containing protein n=1 Tax=Rubricoccus marinus TaxID=716817 RepID=A0A259TWL6_9BACT|nr:DUF3047 domain-containing protein [Rubricoccus marinus]OZC01974.1 hypothetical protein BSZ36_02645 [Rubricoccus marinus]